MIKQKKRSEMERETTWALEDLYESEAAFAEDVRILDREIESFGDYQGRLGESSELFLEMLRSYCQMSQRFEKVYVYANQLLHQDMGDSKSQKMAGEMEIVMNQLNAASSFMVPEILTLDDEKIREYLEEEPALLEFRRFLDNILRQKEHTLDARMEEVLAKAGDMAKGPSNIYAMFNNADITFQPVVTEEGEELALTQGRYVTFLESDNRGIRKQAFENLYAGYAGFKNTLAAVYEANAKQADFYARMRKYPSALEASLDEGNIPISVYDNLIASVHEHLEPMHRYLKLRKKVLGLEELHMYDIYVPMVSQAKRKLSFEEAKETVKRGLAPLGEQYLALLQKGFDNRWIDVYENEGKRTGAYSWGAYGTHPYVLLNYQDNLNNVFTLAHEMGHALHSWYSDEAQPYLYAGYRIFVAEVASTCNEALLIHDLMEHAKSKSEKAYLVNYFLEQFRTTLYRQTMFAEFEKYTHRVVNEGGTLNAEFLCDFYYQLNQNYFGPDVTLDEQIRYEWSRIPHFYTPFYVYQYATGFSAAIAISSRILKGDEQARKGYFKFLSGGSSMDPIDLLKLCGVDMTTKEPVENALQVFSEYVGKFEELLD